MTLQDREKQQLAELNWYARLHNLNELDDDDRVVGAMFKALQIIKAEAERVAEQSAKIAVAEASKPKFVNNKFHKGGVLGEGVRMPSGYGPNPSLEEKLRRVLSKHNMLQHEDVIRSEGLDGIVDYALAKLQLKLRQAEVTAKRVERVEEANDQLEKDLASVRTERNSLMGRMVEIANSGCRYDTEYRPGDWRRGSRHFCYDEAHAGEIPCPSCMAWKELVK